MISSGVLLHSQNLTTVDRCSCSVRDLMPRTRSDHSWVPRIDWTKLNPIRATRMEGWLRLNVPCQGSRRNNAVPWPGQDLCKLELRVSLDKFFGAPARETD